MFSAKSNKFIVRKSNPAQVIGITLKLLMQLSWLKVANQIRRIKILTNPQDKALRAMLDRTAESLWMVARDPVTGLYAHEWDGEDKVPFNVFPAAVSAALALGARAQLLNNIEL